MRLKSDRELKTELNNTQFELLVPANNKNTALCAIKAGADAIYIGYSKYGARAQAGNTLDDIVDVIEFAHSFRVKVYITINTILKDEELNQVEKLIWKLYQHKADGIIIQDMGILELNLPPIPLIASTQCHNNTVEKIKFLEKTGFKRVILPREISLKEIKEISKNTNIELECFIHGALCVSYSGQCYMSCKIGSRSANRGECAQPCRKKYSLKDADGKIIIKDKYLLSMKDLNLSNKLEDLILNGITSFKIEGRLKNEAYVINTTAFYRKKLDEILKKYGLKKSSQGIIEYSFEPDIHKTFNRGYTDFYITGEKNDLATINYTGSSGEYTGKVKSVKEKSFIIDNADFNNGDGICFFNAQNELIGTYINKVCGSEIFPSSMDSIKKGTKIYRNYNKKFEDELKNCVIKRKIPVKLRIRQINTGLIFFLEDEEGNIAGFISEYDIAQNKEKALETLNRQLLKTGGSEFVIINTDIKVKTAPFFKISKINEIRRILCDNLRKIRNKNYNVPKRNSKIVICEYPQKVLDYRANIYNKKAEIFYKKRGCEIKEYAFETSPKTKKHAVLMTSKYCIKKQLGLCGNNQYKEPFVLTDECNKNYLVAFSCLDCVMNILSD